MVGGRRGLGAAIALALCACGGGPDVGPAQPRTPGEARSFASLSQEVLVPRCATSSCHAGSPPTAFPALDADGWAAMVGVPSEQVPVLNLVEPYDPASSYLVLKLRGTAADAGGVATPMPIGDAALDESDIAAIEAWIASGAPND
jgi:hypothetical protein